ncbi:MAG: PilZ domain-containing protein, partial [Myxococcales bacterium]|nr:PilZ domain-containing protein [Myxococcales bacterium]MCB9523701.1 PilZ domain-containing protein [Myxococcales bacterium]
MASPPDRRAHARRHIDPGLGVHATFRDSRIDARVIDISLVGVLVEVPAADVDALPGLNAPIGIELRLGAGAPLECDGRVAWLGGHHRHGERHYRAGLAFGTCDEAQQARLTAFIDALPE